MIRQLMLEVRSVNARKQKARELAQHANIQFVEGCYLVPAQSRAGHYTVLLDNDEALCDCPDFELRDGKPCKHIYAAQIVEREGARTGSPANTAPVAKVKRPTYRQAWKEYNAAQVNERRHFQELLADLCRTIPEPPRKLGRKPIPLRDAIFSACFKVYSTLSARRFSGDLEEAHERGHVGCLPHFNSVLNVFDNAAATDVLVDLIQRSAAPLREVETDFAVDSSGFATSRFVRWHDEKYGTVRQEAEWVKAHIATGVKTNVVTAVVILDKNAADVAQLPALVNDTAKNFTVKEVSADKAYAALENFDAVDAVGGTLYTPFKRNATGAVGGLFEKAFHFFCLHRAKFLTHYHKRSNVESTFSAVKRKFGDAVRSKTDTSMRNEVLAKFVCHNLCCLIAAWYELGIAPEFTPADGCTTMETPAQILRFPGA
jgi:transposase